MFLSDCDYFLHNWPLFRPSLELMDQRLWWIHLVIVDLSFLPSLISSVQIQLSQKLDAPSVSGFHHVSLLNVTQHLLKHTAGVVSSVRWECLAMWCLSSWCELKPRTHRDHGKLARTIFFHTKCTPQDAAARKQLRMIYFVMHLFFPLAGNGKGCRLAFCSSTTTRGLTPDTRPTAQQPTGAVSGLQLNLQAVQHCSTFQLDYLCALFFFLVLFSHGKTLGK